jgi:hypothetical protein
MNKSSDPVRAAWSDADEQFFRCTADLFLPQFLWGSGTLLASYDEVLAQEPTPTQAPVFTPARGRGVSARQRAAHLPPCG